MRTEFGVVLDDPIGGAGAKPGAAFTAHVKHPIRSPENDIVVPSNATVRGRIVAVEGNPPTSIKLKFDEIDTVGGRVPLFATVRDAEPYAASAGEVGEHRGYDAELRALPPNEHDLMRIASTSIGGGPPPALVVLLPRGAEVRLLTLRAIVLPPAARGFH